MDTVGVRELADPASRVVADVERTGKPVVITRRGRRVALVSAIDQEAWEDFVLANAPEYMCAAARRPKPGTPEANVNVRFPT